MKSKDKLSLSDLTNRLYNEDNHYARISRGIQVVYYILIPLYTILGIVEFIETKNTMVLFGAASSVAGFVCFALLFRKFYKMYKYVDYSQPTLIMLKQAVYRYQPLQKESIWAFLALIFIYFGLFSHNVTGLSGWIMHVTFISIFIIAICIGLVIWYYKYKPLRDNALRLIKEIESD